MSVGEDKPVQCRPVAGLRLSASKAAIRYPDRLDLVLMELAAGTQLAGVFTRNAFCAAPVLVAKEHLAAMTAENGSNSYLLTNTGNANAGTGQAGVDAARACCQALAELTGVEASSVLPFSTGVIGELLPADRLIGALPAALASLDTNNWESAARGIMTTDTRPKSSSVEVILSSGPVVISGIAKGAGMIKPNMATMLAYVFTDAKIDKELLDQLLLAAVNQSFNRITVDGDTSTNDCCILAATAQSGVSVEASNQGDLDTFGKALNELCQDLATQLIRDAEGASKFISIEVSGGKDSQECLQVAYCVAESPLVKTAFFASDPNWGRILAAIGRAGIEALQLDKVQIRLGSVLLVESGGLSASYAEEQGQAEMDKECITIQIELNRGAARETVWTSDLSH
ncbi:MAG: bifunctional glutamate N-acetyltransferase/amino-acid acetyltransferase ArgJ, partial [Pseudomonadales bacterium]|nr:bifunctional glutamate N-acetyltransferase/amino-acid acetyltransferase ArgJ [Pseudomonadales bacterium]